MKKIGRNRFFNDLVVDKSIIRDGEISLYDKNEIREIRHNRNFYYQLSGLSKKISTQEKLISDFLSEVPLNNSAIAFRSGLSYLNFLEPHRNGYFFVRFDVRSFFSSLRIDDIRKVFSAYLEDEKLTDDSEQSLVDAFISLVTYTIPVDSPNKILREKTVLPIGFSTSPVVSNIMFRSIDIQLQKFCQPKNITYTRYADDMLFSSNKDSKYVHSESFENEVRVYLSQLGLSINNKKTIKQEHTLSLNGYTIQSNVVNPVAKITSGNIEAVFNPVKSSEIRISNKKTDIIKKIIHMKSVKKLSSLVIMKKLFSFNMKSVYSTKPITPESLARYADHQLFNKVSGYRAYLISILKVNDSYRCVNRKTVDKYSKIIEELTKILDKWVHV